MPSRDDDGALRQVSSSAHRRRAATPTAGAEAAAVDRGVGRRLPALLLGIAASLLLAELAARSLIPVPELRNFHRLLYAGGSDAQAAGEILPAVLRTGWWVSEPDGARIPYSFNLYGFRDREWRVSKVAGIPRVAFVGDSFVEGLGAADDETIARAFGRRAGAQGQALDVMSFGLSGGGFPEYLTVIRDLVPAFEPDHLVLVVYVNDLYSVPPDPEPLLRDVLVAERWSPWESRLGLLLSRAWNDQPVPYRWRPDPGPARPLQVERFFQRAPELSATIDRVADPNLASAMKAGWLSPAVVNLANRSERVLTAAVEVDHVVEALLEYLSDRSVRLWLVYLPSLNQVSDAYLPQQLRISAPIAAPTLTADRFQQQARDLAASADRLGVPFLDLTAGLRRREKEGARLYWGFDSHMNGAGYDAVAGLILSWWASATAF